MGRDGVVEKQQPQSIANFAAALRAAGLPFVPDEPLARHTTFHIGGPAPVFCQPETLPELTASLALCRRHGVRHYLLGNGSNTLFADSGFDGAVISLARLRTRLTFTEHADRAAVTVCAGAGMMLSALCGAAQKQGLTGLEFAYGIPGTVGGAVYMNAGAYGGEMKDVLTSVTYLDEKLHLATLPATELSLGYRTSIFEQKPWCVVEVELSLQQGDAAEIEARMQDFMLRRRTKQPLDLPSAGSTFKRPQGAFAGQLIEQCGLCGYTVGGAQISPKHCGFVVNLGGATCADVVELTQHVKNIVLAQTGYTLEREIRVVE